MYLFSYFKTVDEALYLAVSEDGYTWKEFNGGEAVLRSQVGTGAVRDPFVLQDGQGRFHAVWTDGWESCSIGYAWSDNLLDWQGQKLLPVMEQVAGTVNTWAPEVYYDEAREQFRIIWSSTVLEQGEEKKRDHRIWSVLTPDFQTLGEPALFFDPGYNVIDACVIDAGRGEGYFMTYKDERGVNEPGTDYKAIRSCFIARTGEDRPVYTEPSALLTPPLTEGPSVYATGEGAERHWILLVDKFRERQYAAFRSADLAAWEDVTDRMAFPPGLRHGSVVPFRRPRGQE